MEPEESTSQDSGQDQTEFISWLSQQLNVKTHAELEQKLKDLGTDGIKKAYQQFEQTKQKNASSMKTGGIINHIKCLQAFKRGGMVEAKKCGCGDSVEKNQSGGTVKPFLTLHSDGTTRQWGEDPVVEQATVRKYPLTPSRIPGQIQEIGDDQIAHLTKMVPNFGTVVGQPQAAHPGYVSRFGPDQSDMIRQMLSRFPMPASNVVPVQPTPTIASNKQGGLIQPTWNKKGGKVAKGVMGYDVSTGKDGKKFPMKKDTKDAPDDKKKASTNIKPSWAKKDMKGKANC